LRQVEGTIAVYRCTRLVSTVLALAMSLGLVRLTMSIEDVEGVNGHDAWISARDWVLQPKSYRSEEPDESIAIAIGLVVG
jgi:hypothetical protein